VYCRGIRGATTVEHNDREEILATTAELLQLMISQNELLAEDVASAIFTVTADLDAEFPALAARRLGWTEVALMCAQEIQHVYIRGAVNLRPAFAMSQDG